VNYRHSFHAGNFADILKHVVLMRVLAYLAQKETSFRVIDTHAGAGLYDLGGSEAARTGEWIEGVGRLEGFAFSARARKIMTPFTEALTALSHGGRYYPGSPALIRHALRAQDRAAFNELHPEEFDLLRRLVGRDDRVALTHLDGYTTWKAQIPPPEKRGLVLVDPPFEKEDEFGRLAEGFDLMARKWSNGTTMIWYPVKNHQAVAGFETRCREAGFGKVLVLELHVDDIATGGPLAATGLMLANPPWTLAEEMTVLLPELSACLARGETARWRVDWLRGP